MTEYYKKSYEPSRITQDKFRPIGSTIVVTDMIFDVRLSRGGIIIPNDNGKGYGIRPRWGRVYAVGPDQNDVTVGQWVMVAHGRWTRGVDIEDENGKITIRKVDPNDILLVSDEPQVDETESTAVHLERQSR